ncbi:MAG: tetratricopeptide repeat protein [Planctomycetia bacterium]
MAEAFDALGLVDLAVFTLDQARQKYPKDATLNRALARVFEKRGDFQKAIVLWNLVKETNPTDVEAAHKAKDLAASETIARGGYEAVAAGKAPPPGSKTHAALGAKAGSGTISASGESPRDKLARDEAPLLKRLEADPTEPSLYVQLSTLYRRQGADDRARAVLQQGAGPTGNHFTLQLELHELDLAPLRKNLELADAKLKKIRSRPQDETAEDGPSEDDVLALRSKLAKEVLSRETEILRVKADRFTGDLSHRLELGVRLLKLDRADEAIAELQQARRDERLKGKAALYLAVGFRAKNNWRLAQRNLEDALAALPPTDEASRKEALYQLATGCAENADLIRAVDVGHELANIDFGYKNIGKLLDEWEGAKA